jgi:hypothetical protein
MRETMQTNVEAYRASALECFRHAQSSTDEEVKQTLRTLSARWYALADALEERERSGTPPHRAGTPAHARRA